MNETQAGFLTLLGWLLIMAGLGCLIFGVLGRVVEALGK